MVADGIGCANQLILDSKIILGFLGGPSIMTSVFKRGRERGPRGQIRETAERLGPVLLVLKMEEEDHELKNMNSL